MVDTKLILDLLKEYEKKQGEEVKIEMYPDGSGHITNTRYDEVIAEFNDLDGLESLMVEKLF